MREQRTTGSVEEEARRLVEAAGEWLRTHQGGTSGGRAAGDDGTEDGPTAHDPDGHRDHAGTCQGCPWCRAKAALSGPAGADALEGLADLLAAASESLRLFARSRRQHHTPGTGEDRADETEREGEP